MSNEKRDETNDDERAIRIEIDRNNVERTSESLRDDVSKQEASIAKAIVGSEVGQHEQASLAFKAIVCSAFIVLMVTYPLIVALTKRDGKFVYHPSSAVLLVELGKFLVTGVLCVVVRPSFDGFNARSVVVLALPSIVYMIANNLTYTVLGVASPVTLSVLSNVRLFMVAVIYWLVLARPISRARWIAMFVVAVGLVCSQLRGDMRLAVTGLGLFYILIKALLSVVNGVYTEIVLKHHVSNFHVQNLQMYAWGIITNLLVFLHGSTKPFAEIRSSFFEGFNSFVWVSIFVGAITGIVTGAVMKHLDNIAKFFCVSLSNIILGVLTAYLLPSEFQFSLLFLIGAILVGLASYMYSINGLPDCAKKFLSFESLVDK